MTQSQASEWQEWLRTLTKWAEDGTVCQLWSGLCCLVVSPARASSIWLAGSPVLQVVKLKLKCVLPNYYQWCDVGLEFLYSVLILFNQENFIVHIQAFVHHILLAHLHSILSLLKGVMWLKCPESGRDLKIGTNSEIANFEISMQISRLPIFRRRFELLSLILSECMKPANGKRKCTKGKMLTRYNLR